MTFDDRLGDYLADNDPSDNDGAFQRGVLLAQGRFLPNSVPAFVAGSSAGNVFTALGTQTNSPPVGTIQLAASVSTGIRSNLFTFVGDANLDHDVDQLQAGGEGDGQILMANLGRTGDALWQDGDFNGDKDSDVYQPDARGDAQILVAAMGAGTSPPASAATAAPGTAIATYNPATGDLKVDIGSGLGVVGFGSDGLFKTEIYATAFLPVFFSQISHDVLGLFNAGLPLPIGEYSLGPVLPTGLNPAQIQFAYTPIGSPTVQAMVLLVPEPAAWALACVVAMVGRRRQPGNSNSRGRNG
jgi:hypothetical protein